MTSLLPFPGEPTNRNKPLYARQTARRPGAQRHGAGDRPRLPRDAQRRDRHQAPRRNRGGGRERQRAPVMGQVQQEQR